MAQNKKIVPVSGCCYKGFNPNDYSNDVVDLVEYHVDILTQFQYIVDKSGKKRNFGGWLRVSIKLIERPLFCLGQYEAVFKQYIFTKNMWTHKCKFWLVPKDEGYGIMISAFQSQWFSFWYKLTVSSIKTIKEYCALYPTYTDIYAVTTILGHTNKERINMGRNNLFQQFEYGTSSKVY